MENNIDYMERLAVFVGLYGSFCILVIALVIWRIKKRWFDD
jgi:hypothetical protein